MCFWSRKPPPPPRTPYKYPEALPEGYIRLLKYKGKVSDGHGFFSFLWPGKDVYEIVTVELSRAPAYTAVSYMWGNAERNRTILIDDAHTLDITSSAKSCLNILSDQYLWIDSLCINQDDNEEKTRQVKLMGDIYSRASSVVGVLAQETSERALEVHTLLAFSAASEALSKLWSILDKANFLSSNPRPFDGELSETSYLMSRERRHERLRSVWWEEKFERLEFMAQYDMTRDQMAEYEDYSYRILSENLRSHMKVVRILCHPYWRRVWIIQELAFAKNLTIYFDGQFLTWDRLMRMFDNQEGLENGFLRLERQNYLDPITRSPVRDAYLRGSRLLEMINETRGAPKRILKDVLIDTMGSLATDPRDKIFGILNLVSDEPITHTDTNGVITKAAGLAELDPWFSNPSIFPDYEKHKAQVLTETTMAMIIAGDVNTPLLVGGIGWDRRESDVPSWAIDWSKPPRIYSNISPNARLDMLGKRFWAGIINAKVGDTGFTPLDRKRVMGRFVMQDKIVFLGPSVKADEPEWLHDCWEELCEFLPAKYAWKDFVTFPAITRREALWRVLLDVGETGRPKRHKYNCNNGSCGVETDAFPRDFVASNGEIHLCRDLVERAFHAWAGIEPIPTGRSELTQAFRHALLHSQSLGCRLAVTAKGYLGTVPPYSDLGDIIAIYPNCPAPIVLRKTSEETPDLEVPHICGRLVGKSHFLGLMRAEWANGLDGVDGKEEREEWLKRRMTNVVLI